MNWGYSVSNHKKVWIDASFSKEEKGEIIRAFQAVECSTNYSLVNFEFIENATLSNTHQMSMEPSIVIISVLSSDSRIKESDRKLNKKGKQTIGIFLSSEPIPTILIPKDRIDISRKALFYQVAVHEAIHATFNILTHSESKRAVMFYAMDETSATDITPDDLEYICNELQCNPSSFKICHGDNY